jgi:hypothetical protein
MELSNEFRVSVGIDTAWQVLNDIERIAPCLPGAQLLEIEGDEYRGLVKLKIGPITAQYKGAATFLVQDHAAGRVVLRASGRDIGGGGNASAVVTAFMVPDGDGTKVRVVIDLSLAGRLAQLGRGVLSEVSTNLLGQFVDCLEGKLAGGDESRAGRGVPVPAAGVSGDGLGAGPDGDNGPGAGAPAVRHVEGPDVEPVDLLAAARRSVAKRALPMATGLALVVAFWVWRRRHP